MDMDMSLAHRNNRRDQYMVSFPDGMRDTIKALAEINERTMNAEIVVAIKAHIKAKTEKADVTA